MREHLKKLGINHTTTTKRTRKSNGLAERMNRALLGRIQTILKGAGMPNMLWEEAVYHSAYLYNRAISWVINSRTTHEMFLVAQR